MAKKKKRKKSKGPSAEDIAEVRAGKGSKRDRMEVIKSRARRAHPKRVK